MIIRNYNGFLIILQKDRTIIGSRISYLMLKFDILLIQPRPKWRPWIVQSIRNVILEINSLLFNKLLHLRFRI